MSVWLECPLASEEVDPADVAVLPGSAIKTVKLAAPGAAVTGFPLLVQTRSAVRPGGCGLGTGVEQATPAGIAPPIVMLSPVEADKPPVAVIMSEVLGGLP